MMSVIPVSHALPYSEVRPQKEHSAQAPAHGLILGGGGGGLPKEWHRLVV